MRQISGGVYSAVFTAILEENLVLWPLLSIFKFLISLYLLCKYSLIKDQIISLKLVMQLLWNYLNFSWDILTFTRTMCMTIRWSFSLPRRHRRQALIAERAPQKAEHLEETKGILKRSVNMLLMTTESDSSLKMKFSKSINQRLHANTDNWPDLCCYHRFSYLFTWRVPGENTQTWGRSGLWRNPPASWIFTELGCKYLVSYFTGFLFLVKWHLRRISKIFLFKILITYDFHSMESL